MKTTLAVALSFLALPAAYAAGDPQVLTVDQMKALAARPVVIVAPKYPPAAEKEHIEATVDVIGLVMADGQFLVQRMESTPDREDFKEAIRQVISYWKLVPSYGLHDCQPEVTEGQLRVWFEFKEGRPVISVSRPVSAPRPPAPSEEAGKYMAIKRVDPQDPPYGIRQGMEGRIEALVLIGEDGEVKDVNIAPTALHAVFGKSVRDALRQWRFPPRPGEGAVCGYYEINFALR